MKRLLDIVASGIGLLLLSPLFLAIAVAVKLDSAGPVFFRQERMGRGFNAFLIYKFRTMVADAPKQGSPITYGDDARITRTGRFLRRLKLDELPQLINVVKGDMSLVGPRPEVRLYVERFRVDYATILTERPGITDLASLTFADEAALLGSAQNPEQEYVERILPEKIRLAKEYLRTRSLGGDISLIFRTFFRIFG